MPSESRPASISTASADTLGNSDVAVSRSAPDVSNVLMDAVAGAPIAPPPAAMPPSSCISSAGFAPPGIAAAGAAGVACAGCIVARWSSSCRSVGKSKSRVSGNSIASPSLTASRLRNSTVPSESRPASISGVSAEAEGSSVAATSRTAADVFKPALAAAGTGVDTFTCIAHVSIAPPPVAMLPSNWMSRAGLGALGEGMEGMAAAKVTSLAAEPLVAICSSISGAPGSRVHVSSSGR